ncbi:hypothetical protein GH714_026673 [Hevea brasiliensis]|uniref:Uncharacterized protein n=1 Tax=Hevea brasiliensis TaxID=3981 RepID=A0A6A6ML45_HEVBR|nr:hypothetical protein GH714_026673 [Hevea brasiliensis]
MQMTCTSEQRCSMEYYMQKTYYKTASLISNSCKAIALLAGQTTEVATLAFEYGKNLGLAFQLIDDVLDFTGTFASLGKDSLSDIRHGIVTAPILFAIEEFPQLRAVVQQGFDNPENVDIALEYLGKSRGIHRTRELAAKHASLAAAAIDSLPETDDEEFHQYQVVGRALPSESDEHPKIYRNKLWSTNEVFLRKLKKVKKSNGQVLAINEIFEKNPTKIKKLWYLGALPKSNWVS